MPVGGPLNWNKAHMDDKRSSTSFVGALCRPKKTNSPQELRDVGYKENIAQMTKVVSRRAFLPFTLQRQQDTTEKKGGLSSLDCQKYHSQISIKFSNKEGQNEERGSPPSRKDRLLRPTPTARTSDHPGTFFSPFLSLPSHPPSLLLRTSCPRSSERANAP